MFERIVSGPGNKLPELKYVKAMLKQKYSNLKYLCNMQHFLSLQHFLLENKK